MIVTLRCASPLSSSTVSRPSRAEADGHHD